MKKRVLAALLAVAVLSGCGLNGDEKEKLENLRSRITVVDTEIASMFGKIEDMHQSNEMSEDKYMEFMDLDARADELKKTADKSSPDLETLEKDIKVFENEFATYKTELIQLESKNEDALALELTQLSFATDELESVMKRALENGKVTQEEFDEFTSLKEQVDNYNTNGNIKYDDKFKESFTEIREKLTILANKAGADNSLIDRLIGSANELEVEQDEPDKQELPDNVSVLIDNYLALQDFALEQQAAGKVTDTDIANLLRTGVELTYLKEAVEKDGVTENNTHTTNDIKAKLYEFATGFGYENAEVFK